MKYFVRIDDKRFDIQIEDGGNTAVIDGRTVNLDFKRIRGGKCYSLLIEGVAHEFSMERANGGYDIWHSSGFARAGVTDEKTERFNRLTGTASTGMKAVTLKAPMPGLVIKVEVEPGQKVNKGDGLIIVEAMKMENELKAHAPAVVKEIKVTPGQPVEKNQVLILFE